MHYPFVWINIMTSYILYILVYIHLFHKNIFLFFVFIVHCEWFLRRCRRRARGRHWRAFLFAWVKFIIQLHLMHIKFAIVTHLRIRMTTCQAPVYSHVWRHTHIQKWIIYSQPTELKWKKKKQYNTIAVPVVVVSNAERTMCKCEAKIYLLSWKSVHASFVHEIVWRTGPIEYINMSTFAKFVKVLFRVCDDGVSAHRTWMLSNCAHTIWYSKQRQKKVVVEQNTHFLTCLPNCLHGNCWVCELFAFTIVLFRSFINPMKEQVVE